MSNPSAATACPDAATLRALLDGTLPEDQQAATQAHVDRCPTCEAALRQMTAGGESWIGMAEKLKGGSEDDPKLAAALERLKADDGSGAESSEPAAEPQRTLDFLQPADDPKLLGKLGQHEISEVVGWGGMGVVLKAYDPSLHRVVAVKVLASHLAHHAVARKRFIREAQAAAAVCHDNVVTIHAIEESGPQPKIIMQFVAGGSLQERIDQEGPLELKEILRIAMQTAAGLAAAHAQGVVHRDVKPANILLENGVQRVKLTDFGLARVMDDASLTLSGVIAGTPQYMAPEQAWGRDVDARADLFSLGAVMYAMCSGHSPFRARTTMAVLKRVCESAPRPLRAINPDVPAWLVAIIEKLLAKKPEDRFQTATEVSELLSRWLAHVQQPNVVERPPFVGQVFNLPAQAATENTLAGQVENLPHDHATRWRLSLKLALAPILVTVAVLSVFLILIVKESGTHNLGSYLGFSVFQLAMTLALCSAFFCAWNTTSWIVWIGAMLFFPVAGNAFVLGATYQQPFQASTMTFGLQALLAFAFCFGLLFVRPLLTYVSGEGMRERLTGWQQLFAVACFTIIGTPLVFLLMYWLSYETRQLPGPPTVRGPSQVLVVPTDNPVMSERRPNGFPNPQLLSGGGAAGVGFGGDLSAGGGAATAAPISETLKPLLGRWVVVSSEGAAIGSIAPMGTSGVSSGGFPSASGMAGFGSGFGEMMGGGSGTSVASPPLQWIEFAAEHVVVFDGRQAKVFAEFSEDVEPKQLTLKDLFPGSIAWRNGIYRLDRDRLILCWTNSQRPMPTEFAAENSPGVQLLVLRREWIPLPNLLPPGETPPPPPRAVIPFTADEAKRFQDAWADSANVPVETTNSLGMKLRLIPAGAFDSFQQKMLDSVSYHADGYVAGPAVPRPLYVATHEVTVAQFRKFVEATRYETSAEQTSPTLERPTWRTPGIDQDGDQHPVVQISWQDANAFCRWLSDSEQQSYRLPTLAEWAFAARAGLTVEARIKPPANARLKFFDTTAPVGGDTTNLFGLHDLFGNVGEWTSHIAALNESQHRIALGGGFRNAMTDEMTGRDHLTIHHVQGWLMLRRGDDSAHFDDIGFRVVRDLAKEAKPPAE